MRGRILDHTILRTIAEKHNRTTAQVILRWDLQHGVVTIPKSVHRERIEENSRIFDFKLSDADMVEIDSLDVNQRVGPDPDNFDL